MRAAPRAAKQEKKWPWGWTARLQGVGSATAPCHQGHSRMCNHMQQHPGRPQISPIYCDRDNQSGLSATELVPLAPGGTLPGTIYTSCWALPLGLNAPHARSACLVPHTHIHTVCWPALPTLLGKGGEQDRDGCQHSRASPQPSPTSPGTGVSTSPADKPHRACQDTVPRPGLAATVKSH